MDITQYHFTTRWQIEAPPELLYDILSDPQAYPSWMKHLNIKVTSISKGDALGIGREDHYELRAFLPYTLRWNLKCVRAQKPKGFFSEATGDLEGTGEWIFKPHELFTEVIFDWQVRTRKASLHYLAPLLKPVFAWNHDWVMKRWEKDLRVRAQMQKREVKSY